MKVITACALAAAICVAAQLPGEGQTTMNFEKYEPGKAPAGFTAALTGQGAPGAWEIREDASSPSGKKVLTQTSSDATDSRFPILVYDDVKASDVAVSVRFKAISGKVDQAGGLVARFADHDNYYVVRANALENNVRLYRVVAGRRQQFGGVNEPVSSGQWHTLRLESKGAHFRVSFDGKLLFEAEDATFRGPGKVGLWTKADSVTEFDEFSFASLDTRKP